MINVIGQCVESGNEAGARQLFDVFETLLILVSFDHEKLRYMQSTDISHPQEIPLLSNHITQLAEFLLRCGANRNYDAELRVLALNALNWTVQ